MSNQKNNFITNPAESAGINAPLSGESKTVETDKNGNAVLKNISAANLTEEAPARQPQFGRAFKAMVSTDWMITPDAYKQMLAVAARINPEKAIMPPDEESVPGASRMRIRDGVGIIPVMGPIFPYANMFTYYCGGTTVSSLKKDLILALNSPQEIFALMLEIHSPGGEVTGISEFAEMLYQARKRLPITARIGGYGCSAGYWIASAAGDIAVDNTAVVGSIGVCTAYLDDTKNLEMNGFEEINIISSQSPYKNMPPTTDEGLAKSQARVDRLADIFVETVARNRDTTVKKVLKDFGQGDVLIGEDAVDAGMADRLGSYEECVEMLARAHTPGYAQSRTSATLNFRSDLALENDAEKNSPTTNLQQHSDTGEENMEETTVTKTETVQTETAAEQAATESAPSATDQRIAKLEAELAAEKKARIEADQSAKEKTAALEAEKTRAEFAGIAKDFTGDKAAKTDFLTELADKFGRDSAQVKTYVEDQKALAAQIEAGAVMKEQGAGGGDSETSASEQIEKLAEERAVEKKISKEQAITDIASENPQLYERYNREQQGA